MQINMESPDKHTIQSYDNTHIVVNNTSFNHSVIINHEIIISPWLIRSVNEITEEHLSPLLDLKPEVIIIGHNQPMSRIPFPMIELLAKQRIGIECMSIGAASRTFNLLLSEQRAVIAGIVFT